MTRNFARITKKLTERLNKNACIKGHRGDTPDPFLKRPSVALLFCQQLVVCQVTFPERKGLPGFVCATTPTQAQPITTRPVSLLSSQGNAC